jgi:hypothetical protein
MKSIDYMELGLIELEYAAADCLYKKDSAADPSERVEIDALLARIKAAKVAILYALDSMSSSSDRGLPQAA